MEYGENINKEFEGGNILLFFACQNRKTAVVKYLVEQGADINKEDNNGFNSFFLCLSRRTLRYSEIFIGTWSKYK